VLLVGLGITIDHSTPLIGLTAFTTITIAAAATGLALNKRTA